MTGDLKLTGAKELDAALREMSSEVAGRLGSNAVRAGARVVAAEAKNRAPVDTGALRKSIRVRSGRRKAGERSALVGSDVRYAGIVEFGSRFMAARSFLRSAGDTSGQAAVDKMISNLKAGVARVAVRHKGRGAP